jgi:hypothetical protein
VLPAGAHLPGRMRRQRRRRGRRGRCWSGRGRCRLGGAHQLLEADERVGAQHQRPPACDARRLGEALVGPAAVILGRLNPLVHPGAQAKGVADGRLDLPRQIGHEGPGRLRGEGRRVRGDLVLAYCLAGAVDRLTEKALLALPSGEHAREGAPARLADPLTREHPDPLVGAQGPPVVQAQAVQCAGESSAPVNALLSPSSLSASTTLPRKPRATSSSTSSTASWGWVVYTSPGLRRDAGLTRRNRSGNVVVPSRPSALPETMPLASGCRCPMYCVAT